MNDMAFERDLRAFLHSLAPADLPAALDRAVRSLPEGKTSATPRWFERAAGVVVGATAMVLVVVIGSVAVLNTTRPLETAGPGGAAQATSWKTQMVEMQAKEVAIDVAGRSFVMPADVDYVISDPGSSSYRTLELGWSDEGTEMRLNMYFAADAASWWVSHIRTYDGREPGDWIYYPGAGLFQSPLGESYVGDVSLFGIGFGGVGRFRIDDMTLTAFEPGTVPPTFDRCVAVGARVDFDPLGPPIAHEINTPDLSAFGVAPGMEARDVGAALTSHNVCHVFRLEYPMLNQAQIWCAPPPGKVNSFLIGSSGEIIALVTAGPDRTPDPQTPQVVGC